MRSGLGLVLATWALSGSCGDDTVALHPPFSLDSGGGTTLRVDPGANEITLTHAGAPLLRFPADGFELGTLPQVSDRTNYDPYPIVSRAAVWPSPDGLRWLSPSRIEVTEVSASAATLSLAYPDGLRAQLRIEVARPGSFRAHLVPAGGHSPVAYFRLRPRADAQEGFYGLGEYFDAVNHRGKVRAMQLELDTMIESNYNEAHVPIPFVIGTRGWGLFVECPHPAAFALATDAPDLIDALFGTGTASGPGLTFHLYAADHPLDVTKLYYDDTGYPRLPARWALGPWLWRNENRDQAQVESDATMMRELDLAHSALWIDRPYATAVNTFDFNPTQFPMPQSMIDLLHSLGFGVALWHTPYLDEHSSATAALRDQATSRGFYPAQSGILLNNWGQPIDLTNPDAYAWWQALLRRYTDMGVAGFKLDYGEDVVTGISNGRNAWRFADGSDEQTMHARYQLFYHRVYAQTLPQEGGFLLCRSGTYGDQTNVSVIWPGDLDASFAQRGATVMSGTSSYVAVGGLPASLVAGLSLGPSGFPFYGADTGGYIHAPPDKELFTRWFEQTALSTVMQIGNGAGTVAWEPNPQTGFDAEMLGWYRIYTRLHLRLFPYEWTYAQRLASDGRPIMRPLGLAYPALGVHPNDTYLFGDALLVAPVVARGQTTRDLTLPPGRWIDWWRGDAYDGGRMVTLAAPLDVLPLLLAEGGIVPLLRPTIDSLSPTTQPIRVDSYATTPGVLYVRVAPGAASQFQVFDGTLLSQARSAGMLMLGASDGAEFHYGTLFEVMTVAAPPTAVTADGLALGQKPDLATLEAAPSGWSWESARGGTLYVKLTAGAHQVLATLQ